jgi:hypothetical protein
LEHRCGSPGHGSTLFVIEDGERRGHRGVGQLLGPVFLLAQFVGDDGRLLLFVAVQSEDLRTLEVAGRDDVEVGVIHRANMESSP